MSSTTFDRNIFFKALLPILTCIVIWLIPIPEGLEPKAWHMFAIFAATIVGILTQPIASGAIIDAARDKYIIKSEINTRKYFFCM